MSVNPQGRHKPSFPKEELLTQAGCRCENCEWYRQFITRSGAEREARPFEARRLEDGELGRDRPLGTEAHRDRSPSKGCSPPLRVRRGT